MLVACSRPTAPVKLRSTISVLSLLPCDGDDRPEFTEPDFLGLAASLWCTHPIYLACHFCQIAVRFFWHVPLVPFPPVDRSAPRYASLPWALAGRVYAVDRRGDTIRAWEIRVLSYEERHRDVVSSDPFDRRLQ